MNFNMRVNMESVRGVVLHGKQSENSWQKEGGLSRRFRKSHTDSTAQSRDSYVKDPEKCHIWSRKSYMKDPEKSCADSTVRSRESYKKDLEKSCDDSAAWSRVSYLKDPEKSRAWNRESYMKDPVKSCADSAAPSRKSYKKHLEKSRWNENGLDISYKSKKTAAA